MGPSPLVLPAESPMVEAKHDLTHLTDTERLEKLFTPPFFPFFSHCAAGRLNWKLLFSRNPLMPTPNAAATLKQEAHELIDHLPEGATWRDVAYQAAVRAEAEEGRADIAAGRVIDGDEVLRWIDSWGTDHELEAPQLPR